MIAPSVLASDFANLQSEVEMLNDSEATFIHIDIMDGVFVPNLSFGIPVQKAIHKHSKKPLDVHLMIVEPEKYVQAFRDAGAEYITVHYEACPHLHRNLQQIKLVGAKAGVALNPHTPVSVLKDIISDIDLVLVMSVNPGFGGQKFIENTYNKIKELKEMIVSAGSNTLIEVDGGVNAQNAGPLREAGADILVAGSSVFKATDPKQAISELSNA